MKEEYAVIENDLPVKASPKKVEAHVSTALGGEHSFQTIMEWTEAFRNTLGVYTVRPIREALLQYQEGVPEGLVLASNEVTRTYTATDISGTALTSKVTKLQDAVDKRAETERAKYVTTIWGQDAIYLDKEKEALAYQADDQSPTPYLSAEAAALGQTVSEVVTRVVTNAASWRTLSVIVEANRVKLKASLDNVSTAADLRAIDIEAGWTA